MTIRQYPYRYSVPPIFFRSEYRYTKLRRYTPKNVYNIFSNILDVIQLPNLVDVKCMLLSFWNAEKQKRDITVDSSKCLSLLFCKIISDRHKNATCIEHLEMQMHGHKKTLPRGLVKTPNNYSCLFLMHHYSFSLRMCT